MSYSLRPFIWISLLLVVALPVAACTATDEGAEPDAPPAATGTATPTPKPESVYARQAWERGPHADTYALEKGPNTYCARCHSPANWDRSATIDPPPNCVSCKFPGESEPRVAEGNPLVPEEEWESIDCAVCHRVEDGVVDGAIVWKDTETGYYETVGNSTELCAQCHRNTETLRHARPLGDEAHADFTCTACHDPHAVTASCSDRGCHAAMALPLPTPLPEHADQSKVGECGECHSPADAHMDVLDFVPVACMDCHEDIFVGVGRPLLQEGHSESHVDVACIACHDASGLEVRPPEDGDQWMTFRTIQLLGQSQTEPYRSHQLTRDVACSRCHAEGNRWDLPPVHTEEGYDDE